MAEQEAGQTKETHPVKGFFVFMGLVVFALVIIVGYVIRSYFSS
jgi:hypothetical protein